MGPKTPSLAHPAPAQWGMNYRFRDKRFSAARSRQRWRPITKAAPQGRAQQLPEGWLGRKLKLSLSVTEDPWPPGAVESALEVLAACG